MNANADQPNPYAPPTAKVEDAVESGENELAGRGARLGAAMLDGLVFTVVVYVPLFIGIGSELIAAAQNPQSIWRTIFLKSGVAGVVALVGFLVICAINFVLVKRNSQTIGKKIVGIKVVRSDGSAISLGRIFWMRNVITWILSAIPRIGSLFGLIDTLFIFGAKRQCLHDKIADTIVINA